MGKTAMEVLAHYGLEDLVAQQNPSDKQLEILEHYGIKGMKWGVRRDRRTLDRLAGRKPGKPRPSKPTQDVNRLNNRQRRAERRESRQNRRNLSTSDIREKIDRLKLEKELTKLTNEDLNPIRTRLVQTLTNSGWDVAGKVTTATLTVLTRSALEKEYLGAAEISKYLKPKK